MSDFDFVQRDAAVRDASGKRPIWFVTGTDTDVGKSMVAARLAIVVREQYGRVTIVKPVQTGLAPGIAGDAAVAGAIAGCEWVELIRWPLPADPWLAAVDAHAEPVRVATLCRAIDAIEGPLVVEGAGGIAVPLNADETFVDLAVRLDAEVVVAVGVRLGCINHASLTATLIRERCPRFCGFMLVDRWSKSDERYLAHLRNVLELQGEVVGYMPWQDAAALVISAD